MLSLVLKRGGEIRSPKSLLTKLELFQNRPELINEAEYLVESDVSRKVFDFFITRFYGADSTETVTIDNVHELRELCNEFGFHGFDEEISSLLGRGDSMTQRDIMELRSRIDEHDLLLEDMRWHIMHASSAARSATSLAR